MKKHDGWVLKSLGCGNPYLISSFFHQYRRDVIKQIDETIAVGYKRWKKGFGKQYRIVKVKLTEVQ